MAAGSPTPEHIETRAQHVEAALGERLPVTRWMLLLSLVEDYLMARGVLTLSRWRTAAEELEVSQKSLRSAFEDTDPD
jgi:hypothetical protein